MVSFLAAIPRRLAAVSVLAAALLWSAPSPAQTVYSVTNTADAGAGSLRQAVTSLNGSGAEGIISFVTGSSGTIGLASGLTLTRQASLLNASGGGVTVRLSGTSNLAALTATSLGTLGGASALAIEATGTGSNVSAISSASTLTIGSIGATASITATAVEDDVYGIRAVGDMTVTGQLAGSVTASSTVWMGFRAYGLASDTGSVTIGSIAETGRILAEIASDSSYGISGATGVTIVGEMAGDIEAVSGVGFSIGSDAYGLYSSGGAISIGAIAETGSITARGEASSAYGIRASGDVAIGRMAGDISATSEMGFSAYGILSANGSITIGSIAETGSISSLSGASFTGAVFATTGDVEITGAMAGRISATSTADAGGGTHVYGIAAYDGAVTIGSIAATGVISALAARERAYAVYADGDLTIAGGMAGMISATAGGHTALGIWSGGTLGGGGASTPVSISGTVSAQAGGLAVAVGANGTMNLYVTGTLSGVDASGGGNGYAIRAGASNGIGGWTTGNADNTVTLGTGAHLVGKVDLGTGNNTLNLIGTGSAANLFVGVDTLVAGDGTTATSWTLNPVAADASIYGAVTVNPLASLTVNENVALPATVLDNGNLTFDLATNLGYAGVISGSGSLTKTGEAALFLIGATTYTGTTLVAEGGLNIIQTLNSRSIGIYAGATLDLDQDYTAQDYAMVNGTLIVPELTVARGATLYGSGTIQGDVTDNGTISPGNSPGTLTILGNLTLNSGSLLSMEITPSANDLLAVSGTTTIHGGTLSAFVSQGFYANGQSFVLLTSGGGITGIFDAMSVNCASPFLHFEFDEDADSIEVSVTRLPYTMAGTSRNSMGAAIGLTGATSLATPSMQAVLGTIDFMSVSEVARGLRQMSPEPYSALTETAFSSMGLFSDTIRDRAYARRSGGETLLTAVSAGNIGRLTQLASAAGVSDAGSGLSIKGTGTGMALFVKPVGQYQSVDNGHNRTGYQSWQYGVMAGGDAQVTDNFLAGFQVGFVHSNLRFKDDATSTGFSDAFLGGVYASATSGGFYADGLVQAGAAVNHLDRKIEFGSIAREPTGKYTSFLFGASLSTGYDWTFGDWKAGPVATLDYGYVSNPGFAESDPDLGLTVQGFTGNSLKTGLGAKVSGTFAVGEKTTVSPDLSLRWGHEFLDDSTTISARYNGSPTSGFTSRTGEPARDSLLVDAGVSFGVSESTKLYVRYSGQFLARGTQTQAGAVGVRYEF